LKYSKSILSVSIILHFFGFIFWFYFLVLFFGFIFWFYFLVLFFGFIFWFYFLIFNLIINTVDSYFNYVFFKKLSF